MRASVTCPFCNDKITTDAKPGFHTYDEIVNLLRRGLREHLSPKYNECAGLPESNVHQPGFGDSVIPDL